MYLISVIAVHKIKFDMVTDASRLPSTERLAVNPLKEAEWRIYAPVN